jgi:6-phosphogluconolactonase
VGGATLDSRNYDQRTETREAMSAAATNFYASVGEQLVHYEASIADAVLTRRAAVALPANVQYVWPHSSGEYLYVASSDGVRRQPGQKHHLTTFRVARDGSLAQVGGPLALPYRPIHVTANGSGEWLATTFNYAGSNRGPGTVLLHRVVKGGAALEPCASDGAVDAGMFPHQARFTPGGDALVVCARGNNASAEHGEDLGALKGFRLGSGKLNPDSQVQYPAGLGPRHLDMHPTRPWLFVSMERGNKLCVHRLQNGGAVASPVLFAPSTLADEGNGRRVRQIACAVHVHPAGTHVYVSNRADGTVASGAAQVFDGGENNIAVFRIDEKTGEPRIIQHADTRGIHPRTFSIDRTGRLLVAANLMTRRTHDGVDIPPSIALFRVLPDGQLEFVRKYDLDAGSKAPFWTGLV